MALSEPLGTGLFVGNFLLGMTVFVAHKYGVQEVRATQRVRAWALGRRRGSVPVGPAQGQPSAQAHTGLLLGAPWCTRARPCARTPAPPQVALCRNHFTKDILVYLLAVTSVLYCLLVGKVRPISAARSLLVCVVHPGRLTLRGSGACPAVAVAATAAAAAAS